MDEYTIKKGPGLAPPQKIGDLARSALYANKPDDWFLGEQPGDDFGYDFQAIAFDPNGQGAQCAFNIQLKGTTQKASKLADGTALTYPFNKSTLNLWHRSGFAVLVVIVDLTETQDPKSAPVHYHFANYDLQEILPTLPDDQQTVRLHVPRDRVVHQHLDILPEVLPYLDEIASAQREHRERRRAAGTTTPDSMSLGAADASASIGPTSFSDEIETLIEASANPIELKAALTALRTGDYERVLEYCPPPTADFCHSQPKDASIIAYLRSMAFDALGNSDAARELIRQAALLAPDCDSFIGAVAQKQLETIEFGEAGQHARDELLQSIEHHTGPSVTTVKAKILALDRDFTGARVKLEGFPRDKIVTVEIAVSIIERNWNRALTEVATARELPTLKPRQRLSLDLFEARARFEQAFQAVPRPAEGEFIIPSTGLAHIDYDSLRLAYDAGMAAMMAAQRLNWPSEVQYVLDVFPLAAMLLGHVADAMPLLAAVGLARAEVTPIREIVAKLAVQYDQPEIALQLKQRAGASAPFEHEDAVMAVAALKAGHIGKALNFVSDDFLADPSSKDVYLTSLALLGMAANSTLEAALFEKIRARLDIDANARHWGAILDSAVSVQQSPLRRPEAIRKLHAYWTENGRPNNVGYHLLTNTDPQSEDEAQLFLEVAQSLEVENDFGNEQLADYGQALLTLGKAEEAVAKLRSASNRFRDDPKILSLLGVALEISGQSAEAFELFEQLLNSGKASELARRYFVEIAARMGFFERAEEHVRAAYAATTDRRRKLHLLNTLFQLLLAEGKRPEETAEIAWEYGKQANQSDEREEGIFLQEYLVATLPETLPIRQDRLEEFRRRLDAYAERFPKSKYLWRADVPSDGPPEAMVAALKEAVGLTDADIQNANATERKMDRGALEVPFSWRPRRFLQNVSDVFMLWEIRKSAPLERAAMHFRANVADYDRGTPQDLYDREAVLSLTSLLLLDELGLLELVTKTFPHLVVARATLVALQEARSAVAGGWGRGRATRIMGQLQQSFSKISHPPQAGNEDVHGVIPAWHEEEKRAMGHPRRVYFSDDIVETFLVCTGGENILHKPSISTVEFMTWADKTAHVVSPHQVADVIGHMTRLKVMSVTIEQHYLIAAIPDALNKATSQAQAEAAWHDAETLRSILDGVWTHFSAFEELRNHFAGNISYLLTASANEEVLVSLWLRWLGTVRFQPKPNYPAIDKMLAAFVAILAQLPENKDAVSLHWHSFWTALHRGLGAELDRPEDRLAIEGVAKMLGRGRAKKETEATAAVQFEKAKLGLEAGTEREEWFTAQYIESMVQAELVERKRRGRG